MLRKLHSIIFGYVVFVLRQFTEHLRSLNILLWHIIGRIYRRSFVLKKLQGLVFGNAVGILCRLLGYLKKIIIYKYSFTSNLSLTVSSISLH